VGIQTFYEFDFRYKDRGWFDMKNKNNILVILSLFVATIGLHGSALYGYWRFDDPVLLLNAIDYLEFNSRSEAVGSLSQLCILSLGFTAPERFEISLMDGLSGYCDRWLKRI